MVGHSLGAGISTLLAMMWQDDHPFVRRPPLQWMQSATHCDHTCVRVCVCIDAAQGLHSVDAVAVASPACVSPDLASQAARNGFVTSIVLEDDVVPRLSIHSVLELLTRVCGGAVNATLRVVADASCVMHGGMEWRVSHHHAGESTREGGARVSHHPGASRQHWTRARVQCCT